VVYIRQQKIKTQNYIAFIKIDSLQTVEGYESLRFVCKGFITIRTYASNLSRKDPFGSSVDHYFAITRYRINTYDDERAP